MPVYHPPDATGDHGVDRRQFLAKSGALVMASAAAGRTMNDQQPDRPPAVEPFELEATTIARLRAAMESGEHTSRSICERYLERIAAIDKRGPAINAVIELNPDALTIADALDAELASGRVRGPLHGIPAMVKDNIDTADRMHTTAGSLALIDSAPARDAFIVRRLREAGAVVLGKTNLSEWANFRSMRSSSGWSARGGQTRNPYCLDRSPCGSSSGSGAGPTADLCAAAVGTETDGSIVCPSSTNSIVGVKPTVGLVSRTGIVPISHSQDTAGPMARSVEDAATLLSVLAGYDEDDVATVPSRDRTSVDYRQYLDPAGLRGARIGVARNICGFHEKVDALFEDALVAMASEGAIIVDPADMVLDKTVGDSEFEVLLHEFKANLNAYLARRGVDEHVRTLAGLIDFNNRNAAAEMPYFRQEVFERAVEKGGLDSQEYLSARESSQRLARESIDAVLREHRLDAIVAPTGGPACPIDLVTGDHFLGGSSQAPAVAGYPHVTVPTGYVFGLPVGVSFISTAYAEPVLLRLAYAYEQATQHRRSPRFLPTADLG